MTYVTFRTFEAGLNRIAVGVRRAYQKIVKTLTRSYVFNSPSVTTPSAVTLLQAVDGTLNKIN